eukprot:CAMPEP_0114364550 /NCGR_PEP_ID=MMETSP0101-20121206/27596_1 /TAXON_ID=38822 ORGANISM="Pteridomonas danica, Strain PT" /NCGR_SAMPLE_ID=MMETSP0101 /ASSEMBLY_ACC=CAM_ASM_000211 /LENGTH=728 /DNA_ID=CAMNT_0001512139 /DNA_START=344 /DNA_END=2530 /DNA_ORIENTATION=-
MIDLDISSQIASIIWHLLEASKSNLMELDGHDNSCDSASTPGCIVSSVPASFLSSQRRILENALTIACTTHNYENKLKQIKENGKESVDADNSYKLPHVGLLTDGAAVALTYGFDRRNEIEKEMKQSEISSTFSASTSTSFKNDSNLETMNNNTIINDKQNAVILSKGRIVCFVDFGYSHLQVTIAQITNIGATILSHTGDQDISGNKLDNLLFHLAIKKLNDTGKWKNLLPYKNDQDSEVDGLLITTEGKLTKPGIRLQEACMKAKVTLSANPLANVMVEFLDGNRDARLSFTREEFEKEMLTQHIPEKLKATCREAMKLAKIDPGTLHSTELLGGVSYIPSLRSIVDSTMAHFSPILKGVRQTMDPVDSVARGCAISAANVLSHSPYDNRGRVVIPYSVIDCSAYPLILNSWTDTQSESPTKDTENLLTSTSKYLFDKMTNKGGKGEPKEGEKEAEGSKDNKDEKKEKDADDKEALTSLPLHHVSRYIPPGQSYPLSLSVDFDHLPINSKNVIMDIYEDNSGTAFNHDQVSDINEALEQHPKNDEMMDDEYIDDDAAPTTNHDELFLGRFYLSSGNSKKKLKNNQIRIDNTKLKTKFLMDSRRHVDIHQASFDWSENTDVKEVEIATETEIKTNENNENNENNNSTDNDDDGNDKVNNDNKEETIKSTKELKNVKLETNRIFKTLPLIISTLDIASPSTIHTCNPGGIFLNNNKKSFTKEDKIIIS